MIKIKHFFINLIQKEKKNFFESILFVFLYMCSIIYAIAVWLKNVSYEHRFLVPHSAGGKVISVGNLSWGGSGKTSLVMYLHQKLSEFCAVASITKGYAQDEFLLLKEKVGSVFDAKNRVALINRLSRDYAVFILDDGFQYRKLARDLDIVVIGAHELTKRFHLLPASIFREPLGSLKRADIVVLTYYRKIPHIDAVTKRLLALNPGLKIYHADYVFNGFLDKDRQRKDISFFKTQGCAVLTAIGYPHGFLEVIQREDIIPKKVMIYPDHYQFSARDIFHIEDELKSLGIENVLITHKDFYHLDLVKAKLDYFIVDVELKVQNATDFLDEVHNVLAH